MSSDSARKLVDATLAGYLAPEPSIDAAQLDPLDIERTAYEMRVRDAARVKVAQMSGLQPKQPSIVQLDDFLAVEDDPTRYRIEGLLPVGSSALLAALHKAGKSVLVGNVIKALADGGELLGRFRAHPARVTLIDDELDERMLRRRMRSHGVKNREAVRVIALHGNVASLNLLDANVRTEWAERLRGSDVVILDCLRPVLDALGLDENHDAGRFLVALDETLSAAGVSECIVVTHMGHGGEHARGDSRLLDWAGAIWNITLDAQRRAGQTSTPRYFKAYGRDVDVLEAQLHFDPATLALTLASESRAGVEQSTTLDAICALLRDADEPLSQREIETALSTEYTRKGIRSAIARGVESELIVRSPGPRNSYLHQVAKPDGQLPS